MSKHEERKEILDMVDQMINHLHMIRCNVINYDYSSSNISLASLLEFDAADLKNMLHEAKVCNTKE